MNERRMSGRPPLPVGSRVVDRHSVAIKLMPDDMKTLAKLAEDAGMRPGPFATEMIVEILRSPECQQHVSAQEAFDYKAS